MLLVLVGGEDDESVGHPHLCVSKSCRSVGSPREAVSLGLSLLRHGHPTVQLMARVLSELSVNRLKLHFLFCFT